jgi:hypothetical protein
MDPDPNPDPHIVFRLDPDKIDADPDKIDADPKHCCGSASKKCGRGSRKKFQCGCGSGFMPLLNYGDPSDGIRNF